MRPRNKLAVSNIAWDASDDIRVYQSLRKYGFLGIEIAPTRLIVEEPYSPPNPLTASRLASSIRRDFHLSICSMQSIWYGRQEHLFGSAAERDFLLGYTKKAIDFSVAVGCPHIVFGSPRNRNIPLEGKIQNAVNFFLECAT